MWMRHCVLLLLPLSAHCSARQYNSQSAPIYKSRPMSHLSYTQNSYPHAPSNEPQRPTIGYGFIPRHPIINYLSPTVAEPDSARCYSCMSTLYEAVWPALSKIFKKPRNFTDDCAEAHISGSRSAPVVHCPTVCVSLYETPNIGGFRINGHIRGCMNDILINGFNQTIVSWYRWMHRDSCRVYRKRELFKLPGIDDDSTIEVCTCYADYCNGDSVTSHAHLLFLFFIPLLATFYLTQAFFL